MAGSPLYTNKDADRQYWMGGPWAEKDAAPQSMTGLSSATGSDSTIDDYVNQARAALASSGRLEAENGQNALTASHSTTPEEQRQLPLAIRIGDVVGPASKGIGLAAASTLGGPVGLAADTYMGYEGIRNAIENPTPWNIGEAAFGAGMGLKGLRGAGAGKLVQSVASKLPLIGRFVKPAEEAAAVAPDILRGAEMYADAGKGASARYGKSATAGGSARSTTGYNTAPQSPFTPASPFDPHMPNISGAGQVPNGEHEVLSGLDSAIDHHMPNTSGAGGPVGEAPGQAMPGMEPQLDRYMPNTSAGPSSVTTNASGESAASMEALNRASGMKARGEQFGTFDRAGNFKPKIGPDAVDHVPAKGETFGRMDADGHFHVLTDNGGRVPGPKSAGRQADLEGQAKQFQAARKHGVAGMSQVPELSPEELARLSDMIAQLGGK